MRKPYESGCKRWCVGIFGIRRALEPKRVLDLRFQVGRLRHRALTRRCQNGGVLWDRMRRLITRWLPLPTVCHPYPLLRMGRVSTKREAKCIS